MGKLLDSLRKKYCAGNPETKRHIINFLSHKADIEAALNDGLTAKQIWTHMVEEGMTAMSYPSFCRHVRLSIKSTLANEPPPVSPSSKPRKAAKESPQVKVAKTATPLEQLSEEERLELLKQEAFDAVRSRKPTGSLITKPKTREEERKELFG